MFYLQGTDSQNQTFWMGHNGQWVDDKLKAKVFRESEVYDAFHSTLRKNRLLDRSEQMEPTVVKHRGF